MASYIYSIIYLFSFIFLLYTPQEQARALSISHRTDVDSVVSFIFDKVSSISVRRAPHLFTFSPSELCEISIRFFAIKALPALIQTLAASSPDKIERQRENGTDSRPRSVTRNKASVGIDQDSSQVGNDAVPRAKFDVSGESYRGCRQRAPTRAKTDDVASPLCNKRFRQLFTG